MTDQEHERSKAATTFAVEHGKRWREAKAAELATLPAGTVVVINVTNGDFVTGPNRIEAMDTFHQTYGEGTTLSFSFEVGRPVFVGGGIG